MDFIPYHHFTLILFHPKRWNDIFIPSRSIPRHSTLIYFIPSFQTEHKIVIINFLFYYTFQLITPTNILDELGNYESINGDVNCKHHNFKLNIFYPKYVVE
jgi:hypothetical protein